MASNEPLYLGFDLSTQQLKAIIIKPTLEVVFEAKVDFDADFGERYGLHKGVLSNDAEHEVVAPVAMWLEAVDLVLARLKHGKAPLGDVKGISGSCQQHGTVYWSHEADALLDGLDSSKDLVQQLVPAFAHPYAPNWQDHSTQAECDAFDAQLGGGDALARATGSGAHHRFSGPQIMRLRRKHRAMYDATARISLVSSWLASVLLGKIAPLDTSDACGMNLWDIPAQSWNKSLLQVTAGGLENVPELRRKLGDVRTDGGGSMGSISPYFVKRYGFNKDCGIAPFTGDNPGTILALPLRPLDAIVSLGTSSTFLMITPHYEPDPAYHFFNHPTTPGQYMFMLCYKNGGLARERVRDTLPCESAVATRTDWTKFEDLVSKTSPLGRSKPNDPAKLGLYFYLPEIVPNIRAGTWRYTCQPSDQSSIKPVQLDQGSWITSDDARIIVESQALSMRLRSRKLVDSPLPHLPAQPRRIYLVGGGSVSPAIASVMGDVLGGAEGVYRLDVGGNACALGGAYKALWALQRKDEDETFDEFIGKRWKEETAIKKVDVGYKKGVFEEYGQVLGAFERMEAEVGSSGGK